MSIFCASLLASALKTQSGSVGGFSAAGLVHADQSGRASATWISSRAAFDERCPSRFVRRFDPLSASGMRQKKTRIGFAPFLGPFPGHSDHLGAHMYLDRTNLLEEADGRQASETVDGVSSLRLCHDPRIRARLAGPAADLHLVVRGRAGRAPSGWLFLDLDGLGRRGDRGSPLQLCRHRSSPESARASWPQGALLARPGDYPGHSVRASTVPCRTDQCLCRGTQ